MTETTPEELAQMLFSSSPSRPGSIYILPADQNDPDLLTYNFEILITVYMEGLFNIIAVKGGDLSNIENIYNAVTQEDLEFIDPWFQGFGYKLTVIEHDDRDICTRAYCRILLPFTDRNYFATHNITKMYTFVRPRGYVPTSKLEEVYAVLPVGNKYYAIHFSPYIAPLTVNDRCC